MNVLAWPAFRKAAANPHAALLAEALLEQGVDVEDWTPWRALVAPGVLWHLHHPETVLYRRAAWLAWLETGVFVLLLTQARWRGTRILWTIHDLGSNDRLHPALEAWFWQWFTSRVDGVIGLSRHSLELADAQFPAIRGLPHHVVPHGHYRHAYPHGISRATARERLGLDPDGPVLVHFGLLRPYKNVPLLIRRFVEAAIPGATLLIAGKAYDAVIETEVRQCAEAARPVDVRLDLRHIGTDEVQLFFAAADLVVLPYQRILNSGALILALSFDRPVLVPALGSMPEHRQTFGDAWVRLYEGELTAAQLADACRWARETERPALDLHALDWPQLAAQTREIYERS
ncbi:MAG: hypothetical protein R3D25_05405 [Geminicoccaceae bacterium]